MPDSPPQDLPGTEDALEPPADHGERSYLGTGRLLGKVAIVTGADSGIGKAVAIAYAREGADVIVCYLSEDDDAQDTKGWVEKAGRTAILVKGDLADPAHCRDIVAQTVQAFGRVDVLVNNAAVQAYHETFEEIEDEEWDRIIATNLSAMFHLVKASLPHMPRGSSIIGSSSINSDMPMPQLIPYDVTKAGIANMTAGLDAAHPGHDARGRRQELRRPGTDGAARAAQGAGTRLRHAGLERGVVRVRRTHRRHRRDAHPVSRA
jgi:NADP-dependent 3-hydroxy acid dehydrogenase YdfG